ncbi:malic enzyme [Gigaspora margarita]|uniref:Malic enzyme n=1 Tax=Gigaspora margarita TaxID=4874 RepID=A0A8H4ERY3_GIGMA|nr:malic enzyme [Gigaspora margarita]
MSNECVNGRPKNVPSIESIARSPYLNKEKYMFLAWLRNTNVGLFYYLVINELEELVPIIYTLTVGNTCLKYSYIYPFFIPSGVPDGLYLSIDDLPNLTQIIKNYCPYPFSESLTPQIAVITDGSRILGLGDLGINGIAIPIGKLQLYVAGARIDPRRTLPIIIDLGTGAVILPGFINAVQLVEKDIHLTKHRILFFGAGSASIGIAKQLLKFFKIEYGISEEEAKKLVWLVNTKGLVTCDHGDELASHKVYFTCFDNEGR